jgi:hypothetical protein
MQKSHSNFQGELICSPERASSTALACNCETLTPWYWDDTVCVTLEDG